MYLPPQYPHNKGLGRPIYEGLKTIITHDGSFLCSLQTRFKKKSFYNLVLWILIVIKGIKRVVFHKSKECFL